MKNTKARARVRARARARADHPASEPASQPASQQASQPAGRPASQQLAPSQPSSQPEPGPGPGPGPVQKKRHAQNFFFELRFRRSKYSQPPERRYPREKDRPTTCLSPQRDGTQERKIDQQLVSAPKNCSSFF